MYAIIKAGGKQYTVKPGDVLRVEKMEAELGSELKFDVLMIGGDKTFAGGSLGSAAVTAVVTNQQRGPKVVIFKKRRRQGYRRTGGHRQPYTEVFVKSITNPDGQTVNAEGKAAVYSPEKKAAKVAKTKEILEQKRIAARKAGAAAPEAKKAAPAAKKKTAAKKAAPKKAAAGAAKKKTATKKKTAAKKTTKK